MSASIQAYPSRVSRRTSSIDVTPVLDLPQTAAAQRDHAFLDGLAPQLERRRADENQLAQLVGDLHDFVQADAALVAGLVALVAARALERL